MQKYYVEFECTGSSNSYSLQSKWFDSKKKAIDWYKNSFDYLDTNEIFVSLMSAEFEDGELVGDIRIVEDITAKVFLRGK